MAQASHELSGIIVTVVTMNTLRFARLGCAARLASTTQPRCFSVAAKRLAEGDTGSHRGIQGGDSWTKREKAAEDMYIKEREKAIMQLMKEKIAKYDQD